MKISFCSLHRKTSFPGCVRSECGFSAFFSPYITLSCSWFILKATHLRSGIASLHCFRCIWKAAKNCWSRKVSTLLPKCEENLCVMSTVDLTFIALITQRFCSHFGTNVESLRLHFVLHPTTSGIRHCYFLLVCLF